MKMKNEAGIRGGAIVMMSLGEDGAAGVFQHLTPTDIQKLGVAMTQLTHVDRTEIMDSLENFRFEAEQFTTLNLDSSNYIRAVLDKALGGDRAASLLEDIFESKETHGGIDALNWLESAEVAEMIRNEHPQIIATLLVHLDRKRASEVLELFTERLRNDVVLRVATFGGVQPAALEELTSVLSGLQSGKGMKRQRLGGVRAAAEIINMMGTTLEENVIQHVREHDETLAQRIIDEMFVFEDLLEMEDRAIQMILKEVESESLVVALKGSPQELREKFLRNMSQRAAEMLREELELHAPVRVSQAETEQKTILQIVRKLSDAGEISVNKSGDDAYV
jgi:flagellar motor switch protein FliG